MTVMTASQIFRRYVTDGVPASGPNDPNKDDVRAWGTMLESALGSVGLGYATLALISADIAHPANTLAWVYGDATPANNGVYQKAGASGSGSWSRVADLPFEIIRLTVTGGTANDIQVSAPVTPIIPSSKLYLIVPTLPNTGAVTLALNGGSAVSVKDALGSALVNGSWLGGAQYLLANTGTNYQALLSQPVDASGILASAVSARNDAQTAATSAIAAAAGANSILVSRAALAAATVDASIKAVICNGYAAAGDCAPFTMKRVASAPRFGGVRSTDRFLPNGTTDSTNGGWWIYVPSVDGIDACAFGYVADWNGNYSTATNNSPALQSAINFAAQASGYLGADTGGTVGNLVNLPGGSGMLSSMIVQYTGVRIKGKGTHQSCLVMDTAFSTSTHFIRQGTPGDASSVCASQSLGSAGNLTINGTNVSAGIAYLLSPLPISIYSVGNNSGISFTVTGKDLTGSTISETKTGPNNGHVTTNANFSVITSVSASGATTGNVTVGMETYAAFGCLLEDVQLFSTVVNAASGMAMLHTDNSQHVAGVKKVKIFGGNRICANFISGIGGASYVTIEDLETFNHGSESGVASNNPQIVLNYAGPLMMPVRNIVCAGPDAGAASVAISVQGGRINLQNVHIEHVAQGISIVVPNSNVGLVTLQNIIGGSGMDEVIHIDSTTTTGAIYYSMLDSNGATLTIKDDRPSHSNLAAGQYPQWTLI